MPQNIRKHILVFITSFPLAATTAAIKVAKKIAL